MEITNTSMGVYIFTILKISIFYIIIGYIQRNWRAVNELNAGRRLSVARNHATQARTRCVMAIVKWATWRHERDSCLKNEDQLLLRLIFSGCPLPAMTL
jgi:hypothetical protein